MLTEATTLTVVNILSCFLLFERNKRRSDLLLSQTSSHPSPISDILKGKKNTRSLQKMSNRCLDSRFTAGTKPLSFFWICSGGWCQLETSVQFNSALFFGLSDNQSSLQVLHGNPEPNPQLATASKKNSYVTGRNLERDQASRGWRHLSERRIQRFGSATSTISVNDSPAWTWPTL